jgi:hypothetical protein
MRKLVIGFGHQARNGKDAVATFIREKYDRSNGGQYRIDIIPFALQLKQDVNAEIEELMHINGGNAEFAIKTLVHKYGANPSHDIDYNDPLCPYGKHRSLLQNFGDVKRAENPFVYVEALDDKIRASRANVILVPDVRRKNEFKYIDSIEGELVKVERIGYQADPTVAQHITETDLLNAKWASHITCEENLEELRRLSYEFFDAVVEEQSQIPKSSLLHVVTREALRA